MALNAEVIRAGDLRERVTFQTRDAGQDAAGQPILTWSDAFTSWAAIEPLSGRDLIQAQIANAQVTHQVTVRYRSEFADPIQAAKMRIVYGSRIFAITSCLNQLERRRAVVFQVQEGGSDG